MKTLSFKGAITLLCTVHLLTTCIDTDVKTIVYTGVPERENITEITARIIGTLITFEGTIEQHGHCWIEGATTIPTIENNRTQLGTKTERGTFQSNLFGLAPNTEFTIRGYAIVDGQAIYGKPATFRTIGESKPAITTTFITDITRNSAEALGKVNTLGDATISEHGHCWVVADAFNQVQPTIANSRSQLGERSTTGDFSSAITGLTANLTYRVRAYFILAGTTTPVYANTINFTTVQ
jgi:hypothetical protein